MSAKPVALIVGALALGVGASLLVFRADESEIESDDGAKPARSSAIASVKPAQKKTVTKVAVAQTKNETPVRVGASATAKPVGLSAGDDIDEADLTGVAKAICDELQKALDDNRLGAVRKALAKFKAKASAGGLDGQVPVCLRRKAVEALSWFGKKSAVDLMEYMADANEDVANDAANGFEQALSDATMSDIERSDLVKAAMTALNDAEQIDSLMSQLNDMRNSVKVQTITEILSTGTETARTKMQEQMGDYTDSEVTTLEQLETWLKENPDGEDDAETYGGEKKSDAS